jgi:hypothetical protein
MAKRDSMSTARRSRNCRLVAGERTKLMGSPGNGPQTGPILPAAPSARAELRTPIAAWREQLMKADAVLSCVAFTLLYEDWLDADKRPCFADAVIVAQDLVREATERLAFTFHLTG